jgi:O-succinylbenzoic acid--CoA ligase
MAGAVEADLVAILAPRPRAATLVRAAWDAGRAVAVMDPDMPRAALVDALRAVAPTHVIDTDGERRLPDGVPVPAGTAAVVLTSGTTHVPKAVELTFAGVTSIGHGWARAFGEEADDRWLVCVPLHHVSGLAILARASVSGFAVTVHDRFDVRAVGDAPAAGATIVSMVPVMLQRLLDHDAPMHGYRRVVVGGAPLSPALRAHAEAAGVALVEAYGQTETWGGCVLDGRPIAGAQVRLGPLGEIEIAGDMVMRGYRGDPDATRGAFTSDGWLRTGDVGAFGDDGRLRIVDRLRDIVITGGVNVSPVEVEHVLAGHPAVADVAVAGRADPEWGERVVAYVVVRSDVAVPSLADLRAFARDRLGAAKLPRELVLVDAVPRSAGGKILRRQLPAGP